MNHAEIGRRIKKAKPDLLFVSFGCPKQEKWISMHYRSLGVPVCVGVGGTIDFLAGATKRAPRWIQKVGFEWVYRLAQEPRRLLRRYLNDLFWFSQAILQQWWQMRVGTAPAEARSSQKLAELTTRPEGSQIPVPQTLRCVKIVGEMDIQTVRTNALTCEEALACSRYCLLELDEVRFIDSSGMGLLIRLQNKARISSRHLILIAPSEAVRSALKLMRLQDFFNIAADMKEAQKFMENQISAKPAPSAPSPQNIFAWKGEVTAVNVDDVWQTTQTFITACAKNGGLQIDLTAVPFIDSTGLGLMIKARKAAAQLGAKMTFLGAQPNVLNVLRIAKLESLLLNTGA
jgi:anti-anti-sigma factor